MEEGGGGAVVISGVVLLGTRVVSPGMVGGTGVRVGGGSVVVIGSEIRTQTGQHEVGMDRASNN